jgi:hypothetical protein
MTRAAINIVARMNIETFTIELPARHWPMKLESKGMLVGADQGDA